MLPKIKGSTRNVLIVASTNGTRRYMYKNSFEMNPDDLLRSGAKAAGKMLASGYDHLASWSKDMYKSYRVRKMRKGVAKGIKQLRTAVHL